MLKGWLKIGIINILLLQACSPAKQLVPSSRREVIYNPYGACISLQASTGNYYGELIAIDKEDIYVLTNDGTIQVSVEDMLTFTVQLTSDKHKFYSQSLIVLLAPSMLGCIIHYDYLDGFALMGLFVLIPQVFAIGVESQRLGHFVESGDGKDMEQYSKYARFPGGIPDGVNPFVFQKWWEDKTVQRR